VSQRPLLLITRPRAQAGELVARLEAAGCGTVAVPTVAFDATSSARAVDAMLAGLDGAAWLVVTSANGADALAARMAVTGRAVPDSGRVAAVGPATAAALQGAGVRKIGRASGRGRG